MKFIKPTLTAFLLSLLIISCGKKSKLGKLVPKEASMAAIIDEKSIMEKLPWEEVKNTYWFGEMMKDSSLQINHKMFLADPAKMGIDMDAQIVSFILGANNSIHVIRGNIKDVNAYTNFVRSLHPGATVAKDGDLNILKTDEGVIGWNNEKFVGVATQGQVHIPDSLLNSLGMQIHTIPADSLLTICKQTFNLNEDNSLYENERFANLESEEGDVKIWMNVGQMTRSAMGKASGMIGMMKMDKFLDENFTTISFNFTPGNISANMKQYFGKELSDILKKGDGDINTDMIKRIPQQNVAGVFAAHFTPSNILETIKLTGLDGFANMFLAQKGTSLDDLVKATKGDIMVSVGDIRWIPDTSSLKSVGDTAAKKKDEATVLFALAIGDKDAFNKVYNMIQGIQKEEGHKNVFQKKDDTYFALTNTQESLDKFFSGPKADPTFLSAIKDHPVAGFVDLQMIFKAMEPNISKDSAERAYYDLSRAFWNTVYIKGGEWKEGGISNHFEVNLVDKNTNSLRQLNTYIDQIYKTSMAKHSMKRDRETVVTDSVTTKPPTPTKKMKPVKKKK